MDQKKDRIPLLWQQICFDNDVKAFESLYYLLYDALVKFGMMYVNHREVAEEIVGDVFVKTWMGRDNMQHVQRIDTYLFVAVKNQSLNHLKKYSTLHVVVDDYENDVNLIDTTNPQIQLEKKELQVYLDQCINALPQQCRIIFKLIKEDGLKYKEVAEILNISPRTVQTQLVRAMQKLSISLSAYAAQPSATGVSIATFINTVLLLIFSKIFF
ncbi:RNA polymerase sigma-70 factor [Mucilaginibacter auburnensis]|uniref:RNA polymerase sigma-70 factor (ECF subfamily) n=1 Tax=Mucilaginibacter auburnensis TaxID=1457233 RepID=A0A2H9VN49_9SPHI|nr:RNA polymerase sigma-70 factor [Mucilaginibacter auburnensis]PJJ79767.1 RNA polymerase sigma-70 factor (ECF subfamily) [Mucilaginibacter auburnensis]